MENKSFHVEFKERDNQFAFSSMCEELEIGAKSYKAVGVGEREKKEKEKKDNSQSLFDILILE